MQKNVYPVKKSEDGLTFNFYSEGHRGKVEKKVVFQATDNPEAYNLAFGDVNEKGEIDDLVETNNGDMPLVMATVANTLFDFFDRHPDCFVFLEGSTAQRNILYQRIIERHGPQVKNKMWFQAGLRDPKTNIHLQPEPINPEIQYSYFLVGSY